MSDKREEMPEGYTKEYPQFGRTYGSFFVYSPDRKMVGIADSHDEAVKMAKEHRDEQKN